MRHLPVPAEALDHAVCPLSLFGWVVLIAQGVASEERRNPATQIALPTIEVKRNSP